MNPDALLSQVKLIPTSVLIRFTVILLIATSIIINDNTIIVMLIRAFLFMTIDNYLIGGDINNPPFVYSLFRPLLIGRLLSGPRFLS